jgi:hypothetical protein
MEGQWHLLGELLSCQNSVFFYSLFILQLGNWEYADISCLRCMGWGGVVNLFFTLSFIGLAAKLAEQTTM